MLVAVNLMKLERSWSEHTVIRDSWYVAVRPDKLGVEIVAFAEARHTSRKES